MTLFQPLTDEPRMGVIGLGYVGLPLAHGPERIYDGIVLAVAHDEFRQLAIRFVCRDKSAVCAPKSALDRGIVSMRL